MGWVHQIDLLLQLRLPSAAGTHTLSRVEGIGEQGAVLPTPEEQGTAGSSITIDAVRV